MKIKDERKECNEMLKYVEEGEIVEINNILYFVTAEVDYGNSDDKLILVVDIEKGKTIWMYEDTKVNLPYATLAIK